MRFPHLLSVLLLLAAPDLAAQDSVIVIDPNATADSLETTGLAPEVLHELVAEYNDSTSLRFTGGVAIPAGGRLEGRVAVFRGPVEVAGAVDGPLTIINGDLVVRANGRIGGDVLVVGGRLTLEPGGRIDGRTRVYWDAAPVYKLPEGGLAVRERRKTLGELAAAQASFQTGKVRTTLLLATNQTYNRIEGLPIIAGPTFDWQASSAVAGRLELHGIVRTSGAGAPLGKPLGYSVRTDWSFHGTRGFGIGARLYSLVNGIEEQTLSREEIGWWAALSQHDNRDYYNAQGIAGSVYAYVVNPLRLELGLRYQKESTLRTNDPWSLFTTESGWRPSPLIDDGHYTILGLGADYDTRNHRERPTSGWYFHLGYDYAWSNDVAPVSLPPEVRPPLPGSNYGYGRFTFDGRRYTRIFPNARLNFRLWAAGWAAGNPLPVQRRLSLGGPDWLAGYPFRFRTCEQSGSSDPARPALCDRSMLLQTEFRWHFRLGLGFQYRDREHHELDRFIGIDEADFVVLAEGGDAWLSGDGPGRVPNNRIPNLNEWKGDLGFGLDAGGIAAYLVKAVTDGQPVRVLVRLQQRF